MPMINITLTELSEQTTCISYGISIWVYRLSFDFRATKAAVACPTLIHPADVSVRHWVVSEYKCAYFEVNACRNKGKAIPVTGHGDP
jgi:hypothetical protein